jgi:hypothetical protein
VIAAIRLVPHGYHSAAPAITALVVVALVAAVTAAELLRAYGSPAAERWRARMQVAAVPLLVCSVAVVVARLAPLVR